MKPKINPYNWYKTLFRNKKYRPLVIGLTIFYVLMPIDLIPDIFFPIIGYIDDTILITVFVSELLHWLNSDT